MQLKCEQKKMLIVQKLAIKNFSKILLYIHELGQNDLSGANYLDQVSWLLEKNCDFYINTNIWT